MQELTEKILTDVIRKRPENSHKGTFGKSVLIGGNKQYGGAIIMAAQGCINSGCGLTTVITDSANHSALHARLPEAIVINWQEPMEEVLQKAAVILLGPGLGETDNSLQLLKKVLSLQTAKQWLIIDGSAITLIAAHQLTVKFPQQTVFTPHQMEWQRLSRLPINQQTTAANRAYQQKLQSIIVLKSHRTEIYGKTLAKNPLGNPAMATGGMGDTLAGMITGFLAQFEPYEKTVQAAVYLHSYIGDRLAEKNYVVLPTQLSKQIPYWMKQFSS